MLLRTIKKVNIQAYAKMLSSQYDVIDYIVKYWETRDSSYCGLDFYEIKFNNFCVRNKWSDCEMDCRWWVFWLCCDNIDNNNILIDKEKMCKIIFKCEK